VDNEILIPVLIVDLDIGIIRINAKGKIRRERPGCSRPCK
jgi:hypothetical protein